MKISNPLFHLVFAGLAGLSLGACGGDDDNGGNGSANILICQDQCSVDADCDIPGLSLVCTDSRCVSSVDPALTLCESDAQCQLSDNAIEFCEFDLDCGIGRVCVQTDAGDRNVCTFEPLPAGGCLGGEEIIATSLTGGEITVCGEPDAICNEGICQVGCQTDADCPSAVLPVCNTNSGMCNCTATSCQGSGFGDSCVANNTACSCAEATECTMPSPFPNTTKVCE